ncbi:MULTISPECIES: GNAT family N-acetyltransferase [unclassified Paenibacillus]|uniref:GNAT family N-acetyltransferase n=1 Tax=unclassified Paenibacillus TaxID=185978 RepID=UPI002784B42B|nr:MULTISPECIES: GNAT family N-acetyltransferase [unclassified Paenibacillus]MDQ0898555.1 ribosomal protein S18 acetylase RimI-like enzyme [Paenibacillus sp. V4I7]MDQ0915453.1 ribosomal protein S18 acetylase RimI-like enzyme [Paenibacillus sp. V4I5]
MELIIRTAQLEDYEAVNAIIRVGQEEHADALPERFARLDHVVAMGWYRSFSDQQNKVILVAEKEGLVIGVAMLEMKKSPTYEALVPRTFAYLNELAVSPDYLRQGIGTKLYKASIAWARERSAASLELNVWEFNERAIAFYKSLGMFTLNRTMTTTIG